MDSFTKIDTQIKEAKEKRKKIIIDAMDGRTQKSVADKTGIDEIKLSRWVNGTATLEATELEKLETILGVDFK